MAGFDRIEVYRTFGVIENPQCKGKTFYPASHTRFLGYSEDKFF